jgi:hypothetical protein
MACWWSIIRPRKVSILPQTCIATRSIRSSCWRRLRAMRVSRRSVRWPAATSITSRLKGVTGSAHSTSLRLPRAFRKSGRAPAFRSASVSGFVMRRLPPPWPGLPMRSSSVAGSSKKSSNRQRQACDKVLACCTAFRRDGCGNAPACGRNDMGWLNKLLPPKIKRNDSGVARRSSLPEGLWSKCPACEAVLYATDLANNCNVCPKCGHHKRLEARARIDLLLDADGRSEIAAEVLPVDSLSFKDSRRYPERCRMPPTATGETDALVVMRGSIKAAGGPRRFRVRFHGRLDGLGAWRTLRARRSGGDRAGACRSSVSPLRAVRACRRDCSR